ncbi:hypothetical protein ACHAXR_006000 [Thalassiosira sp. AJA248-18]
MLINFATMKFTMLWVVIYVVFSSPLKSVSAFTVISKQFCAQRESWSAPGPIATCTQNSGRIRKRSSKILFAIPPLQWLFPRGNKDADSDTAKEFAGEAAKEAEMMHRTAKMMEDHRRSQEAAERTAAMMDELSSVRVVGKSKAGASGGIGIGGDSRRGGVKVTFNGQQRPVGVEVDPNFLFSSSMSESQGVLSIEELNEAIADAMENGYEQSGSIMQDKIKSLYSQLGLPREPPSLPSEQDTKTRAG